MRARQYVVVEPLHEVPGGPDVDPAGRREALSDALRGVELGAYDERIVAWLLRVGDNETLRTVVSLFERVRETGAVGAIDLEAALQERARALRTGETR